MKRFVETPRPLLDARFEASEHLLPSLIVLLCKEEEVEEAEAAAAAANWLWASKLLTAKARRPHNRANGSRQTMPPRQIPVHRQTQSSIITQKVQLIYKLFLLENARSTLSEDLRSFTNKAYEEVQSFLNSSFPNSEFGDLIKALDVKCQAIVQLSASLKNLTDESQVCVQHTVKNGVKPNQLQPLRVKGILMSDVLKFGPMLQNSLMASSIAKAVQVLGATLSLQQLKCLFTSQPAAAKQDDMICSISTSFNRSILTTSSSCYFKAEEQNVVFEENSQPDVVIVPPAITQTCDINAERPQLLLPPIQAVLTEISNPKPVNITPQICWGCEDDVQVHHQKQTSSQLLHFLREKAKNTGALEVTVMHWTKSTYTSDLAQPKSPIIQTQNYQVRHVGADDVISASSPTTLHKNIENQGPVFRVKRVESSGSLIYSCVIATETELWDIGDIFTEVAKGDSDLNPSEGDDSLNIQAEVENSCVNINWKNQTLKGTEAAQEHNSADAKISACNSVNIPEFQIRKFEETEVVVSHVVSPGNFYIRHTDSIEKLQPLVADWKASSSYAEQNCIPDIGTKVMGWFPKQEQWCRAQVMKICGVSRGNNASDGAERETSIKVEVKRLDHGDTACLSLWNIKELQPEMAALPLQAVQVSLANVTPVNETDWSEEAVDWFKAMVHNRTLYARLYPLGPKVRVELFLEKGTMGAMRRGASLSVRLAKNGHAKHNTLKNASLPKKSTVQLNMQKQESDWEKYLISCYTQNKK